MNFTPLILSGLLLGSSLTGYAQSIDPVPASHFYGGLGVYSSSHQNLSSWGNGARIPVQALVGYQWRPRLAVQLGLAYSGNGIDYAYTNHLYSSVPPSDTTRSTVGTYKEHSVTATLLVRYTLTRKPAHRFQADLLGGVKVEYSRYRDVGSVTSYDRVLTVIASAPYDYPSTYNSTLLSLGASLRYRLVSRLEAVYDLTFDQPITNSSRYALRPQATMALGLRYHFGHG